MRPSRRNALSATRVDVADGHDLDISTVAQRADVTSGDPAGANEPDAKLRLHRNTLLRRIFGDRTDVVGQGVLMLRIGIGSAA